MGSDDDRGGALDATLEVTPRPPGPAGAELAPGASVDRYRLVTRIGAGAMGVVWGARDPELDRAIAIKLVHPDLARDPEAAARLLREARAMAKVSHRNVVAIHDAGRDGEVLFIAMELVAGTNLGQLLSRRTPAEVRDWRRWLALVRDAGRGLAAAHTAGVVHRDFKPENVLVDRAGRVCVGDFGVAELSMPGRSTRWRVGAAERDLTATIDDLTTTGALIGTPAYMSPEQLRGEAADARSDQFAFSVTAWEALFGQRPFPLTPPPGQEALPALLASIERGEPEAPRITPVPRRVREALVRGLSADPKARFADLPALLDAITPRSRWRPALAALAAIAAAAVGAALALGAGRGRHAAPATAATATRKFPVALKVSVSLSPDGTRVSLAAPDQLVVRELDGSKAWTLPLAPNEGVERARFVGDEVHFSARANGAGRVVAWTPTTGATRELAPLGNALWLGHVSDGELVQEVDSSGASHVRVLGPGGAVARGVMTTPRRIEVWAISLDGRRLAYVEDAAFDGRIVIVDLATGATQRSEPIVEVTGLAWRDARRLLYTTGTLERPAVHEIALARDGFGASRVLYRAETGWFGQVEAAGGRVVFVDSTNSFRARLLRPPTAVDLDATRISAGLAWERNDTWLSWNRTTGAIERRDLASTVIATLPADVSGEPGNATRAGRTLVLSMRRTGGRELLALSLDDGHRVWTKPVGEAVLARCAVDDHAPCFAVVQPASGPATLRALDPATGALGADVLYQTTEILDIAVAAAGDEILIVDGTKYLHRLALPSRAVTDEEAGLSTLRSVVYHPLGGYVVAGSGGAARYVAHWRNGAQTSVLIRAESEIVFMPRPSPDGSQFLIMGRLFLPELYELVGAGD
jgi:tRNA A-37 threonylcarbamoyl transferase component Bud32